MIMHQSCCVNYTSFQKKLQNIQVYEPTVSYSDDEIKEFYEGVASMHQKEIAT